MKILHTVEFYSPSVGGAQEVVRQISEQLVQQGHEVFVATSRLAQRSKTVLSGVRIEEFDISGNAVRGFKGEVDRYRDFLRDGKFDIMMNYAAQQWATDLVFPLLDSLPYPKVLAPCGFSALYDPRYRSYFSRMPDVMRLYDHLIFHSHAYRDVDFARQHGLRHYTVLPNGAARCEFEIVDRSFRERYRIPLDIPLLLTVGSHTGSKGHALVMEAFRRARIGPAVLVIIGNTLNGRGCLGSCQLRSWLARLLSFGVKRVLLLNPPRRDVVAAYHAADLFVFGSSVECSPLVIFEAMASRTPFVTVACGNAAEICQWSGGGVVIPTRHLRDGRAAASPGDMARAIEKLVKDSRSRERLGEAGYVAWRREFSWEDIAHRYQALYQGLVQGASAGTTAGSQAGA